MIRRFRDVGQLTNKPSALTLMSYGYLLLIAAATVAAISTGRGDTVTHQDSVVLVLYLIIALILLGRVDVRIDRGRLTLSGIVIGTGTLLLNPLHAALLGMSLGDRKSVV